MTPSPFEICGIGGGNNLTTPLGLAGIDLDSKTERSHDRFLDRRVAGIALAVALAYYLGAKIGFALTFQPHPISVLWPPNSILLAALLLTPVRIWWLILLAAFPAHLAAQLQSNVPPTMIICWFISNSCEALIGAGFVRYLLDRPMRFDRLYNVGIFCFFAGFWGPFLSSFLDSAFVVLNHWGQDSYWEVWRGRFVSNVLATLTLVPFLVIWSSEGIASVRRLRVPRFFEAVLLLLGLLSVNIIVFYKLAPTAESTLLYLPLPFLIWSAVRFGSRGASTTICVLMFLAIWSAGHGYGPFSTKSAHENALAIQIFLIVTSVPLMLLAAVIEERATAGMALRERDERISLAAESAKSGVLDGELRARGESWIMIRAAPCLQLQGSDDPLTRELCLSRVHPEDRNAVNEAIEHARATSPTFEFEYRILRPDGETRWFISRGRYVKNDCGGNTRIDRCCDRCHRASQGNFGLRVQREEMARLSRMSSMGRANRVARARTESTPHRHCQQRRSREARTAQGSLELKMFEELLADISADARRAGNVIHGIHSFVRKAKEPGDR